MNLRDSYPQPYNHSWCTSIGSNTIRNSILRKNFAIEIDGKLAGSVGSDRGKDELRTNMEMGFWVAEPFWGKGIATEAVEALFQLHFSKIRCPAFILASLWLQWPVDECTRKSWVYFQKLFWKRHFIKNGVVGDIFQYVKIRGKSNFPFLSIDSRSLDIVSAHFCFEAG